MTGVGTRDSQRPGSATPTPPLQRVFMELPRSVVPSILSQPLSLPQEAALLYADGRVQDAADRLERAIAPGGGHERDPTAWRMLFDLHRAEGDWTAFEAAAARFEAALLRGETPISMQTVQGPVSQVRQRKPVTERASTGGTPEGADRPLNEFEQAVLEYRKTKKAGFGDSVFG